MRVFLEETKYVNYNSKIIQNKTKELFHNDMSNIEKSTIAFEFVRDKINHTFDIQSNTITSIASDVLKYETGICHTKANLLAALLRSQNIPTGFCFQHITLGTDDSKGYVLHCFNAIYLEGKWIKVDARGNTNGKKAEFSLDKPILAFPNREEYNEYFFEGIFSKPDIETMNVLEKSISLQDVLDGLPDVLSIEPDVVE